MEQNKPEGEPIVLPETETIIDKEDDFPGMDSHLDYTIIDKNTQELLAHVTFIATATPVEISGFFTCMANMLETGRYGNPRRFRTIVGIYRREAERVPGLEKEE